MRWLFLLLISTAALGQTATPVLSPGTGSYTMPLPYTYVTVPSPDTGATVIACYNSNTACTPGSTGTQIKFGSSLTCVVSSSTACGIYVSPQTTVEICSTATATGKSVSAVACALFSSQTSGLATGDARTVTEPTMPTGCTTFRATKYMVKTTAVNIDPFNATAGAANGGTGTQGTLGATGGTSIEPSSSATSYVAAETIDNTAWQAAVNAAAGNSSASGCIELVPGTSGQNAIVLAHWTLPSYVYVMIDGNTRIFESRVPSDYGGSTCGQVLPTTSTSCSKWLISGSSPLVNSGVYGYGVIDGRAWDRFISNSTCGGLAFCGFNYNRVQSYCNNHGKVINGSPQCTPTAGANAIAYGPNTFYIQNAQNFTVYKTTIRDPGNFAVYIGDGTVGATFWGIKIIAPFEVSNTDGWDPSYNSSNISLINSYCESGDNCVAIKSKSSGATKNISILNFQTGSAIGVEIGYESTNVSNILVNGLVQNGNQNNASQQEGHGIKSPQQGGAVSNVTFENICATNVSKALIYNNANGSMTGINDFNDHMLKGSVSGNSGSVNFAGNSSNTGVISLSNVTADSSISNAGFSYATVSFGPNNVSSSITGLSAGIGASKNNNITNSGSTPYPCTPTTWQPLVGEVFLKTPTSSNAQSYTTSASSAAVTLQAVLQPVEMPSIKEQPVLSATTISFYDNGALLGTGALAADGRYATYGPITVTGPSTHNYTAKYNGDANYSAYTFTNSGTTNPVVNVTGGTAPPMGNQTYNITPSTPNSVVVSDLSAMASTTGNTMNFAGGTGGGVATYVPTSTWTFPCVGGNVFQGPVVPFVNGSGASPTAVIAPTFTNSNAVQITGTNAFTTPGSGCTIQYLATKGQNTLISPPVSGLLHQFNSAYNMVGSVGNTGGNATSYAGIYVANGQPIDLGYSTFQWDSLGPSCTDLNSSTTTDYGGTCGGIILQGSNANVSILNNQVNGQLEDFVHTLAAGTYGQNSTNLLIQGNNIAHVHRQAIALNQQNTVNAVVQWNAVTAPYNPAQFTRGYSITCCAQAGGATAPAIQVNDNVLASTTAISGGVTYSPLYGIDLWGNGSTANNNVIQGASTKNALVFGGSATYTSMSLQANSNVLQGGSTAPGCEGTGTFPSCANVTGSPSAMGNMGSATISSQVSAIPYITPIGGSITGPQTVTISDAPDTTIWYTTDGSAPGPGTGTSQIYTGSFMVTAPAIVNAIGMWGVGADPNSYQANYGYVPSSVISASFTVPAVGSNGTLGPFVVGP